jgi:hypothetical protein
MLTEAEIDSFKKDGYLVVREMYDEGAVSAISQWSDEILGWPEEPGRRTDWGRRKHCNFGTFFMSCV